MACFDHFPILISQLVLRTREDHDTVNAEEPVPLLSSRTLAYETNHQNCAIWIGRTILARAMLYLSSRWTIVAQRDQLASWRRQLMIHGAKKLIPKLRKAPQPPLSHPGAIPDSDRAKKPPLGETRATHQELEPGDRVEGLRNFGTPTGEIGTVERANEEDAVVKWDDDGRTRLHQPSLKKI
jgi:hypothetical protein